MYRLSSNFFGVAFAFFNAVLSAAALFFSRDYEIVTKLAWCSVLLFILICWNKRANLLFLARTFILGFIGYFPIFIKITIGMDALFSAFEHSTQNFSISVIMYVTTSFALLSNEIGLALARNGSNSPSRRIRFSNLELHRSKSNLMVIHITDWGIAAFMGIILVLFS